MRRRGACRRSTHESSDDRNEVSSADDANARHIAIVGAGFAGVATAYHVFRQVADAHAEATADGKTVAPVRVTLIDEKGVAGGASGVAAGLLHPYTPRGKIIWRGTEGVAATLELVEAAENAERVMEAATGTRRRRRSRPTSFAAPRARHRATRRRVSSRTVPEAGARPREARAFVVRGGRERCGGLRGGAEAADPGVDVPGGGRGTRRFLRGDGDDGDDGDGASRARPLTRADERAASKKRREERNAPVTSALHVPEGLVLDTTRYLASLWDAARLLASSGETPAGCSATIEIRRVASIEGDEELNAPNAYAAVVIACGAAAGSVRELEGDLLPTQLQGHVVELVPVISERLADGAPGVLGSPYIAPLAPERVLVGTTKEYGASVADARRAGEIPLADAGSAAAAARRRRARARGERGGDVPPRGARRRGAWTWRGGVRANPPRSSLGSLPLVGRVEARDLDARGNRKRG